MIHEIGLALQSRIRARGCPVAVVDGPESTTTTTWGRERIVIEEIGGDTFAPVLSQHKNPKHAMDMIIAARITIYAQSPRAGALVFEHRRRARQILRQVVVALREELTERRNPLSITKGDFITPPDLAKTEIANGAAYELPFAFQTGIPAETWTGDAQPQAALGKVNSTTKVTGDPTALPGAGETSCGD